MAKQVGTIRLKSLSNGALFEYIKEFLMRAGADETIATQLAANFAVLKNKQAAYDEVLKLSQKSEQTEQIRVQDQLRDDNYFAYKHMVEAFLSISTGDQLAAAEKLGQHMKDYKIDPDDDLRKECGMMDNFTGDLKTKYTAEVAALNLTAIVDAMKAANDKVTELLVDRDNANAARVAGETKAARTACETAYRNFIERLNALSIVDGDHDYTTFIDATNEQIEQYRKQVLTKRKSKKAEESGKEESSKVEE